MAVRAPAVLDSISFEDFTRFTVAIDRCLDDLPTVHQGETETLLTHELQMFDNVPLLAAWSITNVRGRDAGRGATKLHRRVAEHDEPSSVVMRGPQFCEKVIIRLLSLGLAGNFGS